MALKDHALVTLATIKTLMTIVDDDSYDTLIETLINMVSRMMIQEIGHNPIYTSYSSISLDGTGRPRLLIPHWPIISVSSLAENDTSLTENTQFLIYDGEDDGYILRISSGLTAGFPEANWSKGNRNIVISYIAGYRFVDALYYDSLSEIPLIGDTLVGASSAVEGDVSKIVQTAGIVGSGTAEGWVEFSTVDGTFTENENINIDGGTANVMTVNHPSTTLWMPDDIQMACAKQVGIEKKRFGAEDWDQTSKTFPDGATSKTIIELHPQVKEVCRKYRRITL